MERLWNSYSTSIPRLSTFLTEYPLIIDHLAIIDLSGEFSGIHVLAKIFELLGMEVNGSGYLPSKQNNFSWMCHKESFSKSPSQAIPQVVIADFDNKQLSAKVRKIVEKYSNLTLPFDEAKLKENIDKVKAGNQSHIELVVNQIENYLITTGRPQPLINEYLEVYQENQLLAWVLLFGRKINHFGLAIYTMDKFTDLQCFNNFIRDKYNIVFNDSGGIIKGGKNCGIEQSSTLGEQVALSFDGKLIEVRNSFIEFVWRYSITESPTKLSDYFCGFVPDNANNVVESLYT